MAWLWGYDLAVAMDGHSYGLAVAMDDKLQPMVFMMFCARRSLLLLIRRREDRAAPAQWQLGGSTIP